LNSDKSSELLDIFDRVLHHNTTRGKVLYRTDKKGLFWIHAWSRYEAEPDEVYPITKEQAFKLVTDGYGNNMYDCSSKDLDNIISKYFPKNKLEED